MVDKASAADFLGRFREIIADPLNLLIRRHPSAGTLLGDQVYLHNGLLVPASGPDTYYADFNNILLINRGVHEPLEEFVFQQLVHVLTSAPRETAPTMLELGAYWGHYSMWLKAALPEASVHLVEPEAKNLDVGRKNFARNGLTASFEHAFVGRGQFQVDNYMRHNALPRLDILHADIQGYELEMLEGCCASFRSRIIDYLCVSTHSQKLHDDVVAALLAADYRVEVSSDFETGTSSFDGFVFASSPEVPSLFDDFRPIGRLQTLDTPPADLLHFLTQTNMAYPLK